jgi:hypothetical protein
VSTTPGHRGLNRRCTDRSSWWYAGISGTGWSCRVGDRPGLVALYDAVRAFSSTPDKLCTDPTISRLA